MKKEKRMTRPKVTLTPMKHTTVIHLPTQKEYDIFMRICECGGWIWKSRSLPTLRNYWDLHNKETCVNVGQNLLGFCDRSLYYNAGYDILTDEEFYNIQGITAEIKTYFARKKSRQIGNF